MKTLFEIQTDRVTLTWQRGGGERSVRFDVGTQPPHFRVVGLSTRPGSSPRVTPDTVATDPPRLFERTPYKLYLRGRDGCPVSVHHRDPQTRDMLTGERDGDVVAGVVNFRGEIGRSVFTIWADGEPELRLELEVFPTKLDYRSDYEQMLAEIQDLAAGLAMQHLSAAEQQGAVTRYTRPTRLEWLTQLQRIEQQLDDATRYIGEHPRRGMIRRDQRIRADRVKRIDASVRRAVRQRRGHGPLQYTRDRVPVHEWLPARTPRPTLDTPEHRWLAARLDAIRRTLVRLRDAEARLKSTTRRAQLIQTLDRLGRSATRWRSIEPLAEVAGPPPQGFASVQLFAAPGYREAALACLELDKSIRIGGRALSLSIRKLNELYEYWCYLTLVRRVAEILDRPIPANQLMSTQYQGIHLQLIKGRSQSVVFTDRSGRRITLTYSPLYRGWPAMLITQQPDMQITIEDRGWPAIHLLLDAKYRLDTDGDYIKQFGTPGPPRDAINAMHRYRDAVLEMDGEGEAVATQHRSVVQAAAVFPYRDHDGEATFETSKLWRALPVIGVGAVPLLPESEDYLDAFLSSGLGRGGWATADATIDHAGIRRANRWRSAAAERVLVAMLPGDDPDAALATVREYRAWAMPLLKHPRQQLAARRLAFYRLSDAAEPGVLGWSAPIRGLRITPRPHRALASGPSGGDHGLWVRFELGPIEPLSRPIHATPEETTLESLGQHRWTTALALERAGCLSELLLETEAEWRLYEALLAARRPPLIRPGKPPSDDWGSAQGRARFVVGDAEARDEGRAGYRIDRPGQPTQYASVLSVVVDALLARKG